jgi:hypothetical protein
MRNLKDMKILHVKVRVSVGWSIVLFTLIPPKLIVYNNTKTNTKKTFIPFFSFLKALKEIIHQIVIKYLTYINILTKRKLCCFV